MYFWDQGPSVGLQKCSKGFHRWCIDYLGLKFIPKKYSTNVEIVLATVGTTFLLAELIGSFKPHKATRPLNEYPSAYIIIFKR